MTSLRRVLVWSLVGHACLLAAAIRHLHFWGTEKVWGIHLSTILGYAEGAALLAFAALAGIPYARAAARGIDASTRTIIGGGLILLLAATAIPPFLSSDVHDNLARGRVQAEYGANPYTMPPSQYPEDPFVRAAQWTSYGNPYGPVSTMAQAAVCWIAGGRVWAGIYLFKLVFALCHLLVAYCVYQAARRVQPDHAKLALYLYLWNPFLLLEAAGSAHNDTLMAVGLGLMVWALAAGNMLFGTVAFGLAVLTKHSSVVLGPLLLVLAWRRRQLGGFVKGVAVVGAITVGFALFYFMERGAIEALLAQAEHRRTSLQRFVEVFLGSTDPQMLIIIGIALSLLFLLWCLPSVRDLESFGLQGAKVTLFFVLIAMPMFSPWYHMWWLPLIGLCAELRRAVCWVAVLAPASYLIFATTRSLALDHQAFQWACGLLPVGVLVLAQRRTVSYAPARDHARTSSSGSLGTETSR